MKIIHTADIHLGASPDPEYNWSKERKEEIWDTFRSLIQKVGEENADLLLIAGDLFHRQPLKSELKEVNDLFLQIPHTRVVLMAGNHDYMKKDSYYRDFTWNENVTFFGSQKLERVYLKKIRTYVYGLSYESDEIQNALYDTCAPGKEAGFHILLAHGGDEKHIPIQFSKLASAGFDYVALGHIHKPRTFERGMAYAGTLEPVDRNDFGSHGYMKVILTEGDSHIQFVPFAKRSYIPLEICVHENMTQSELEAVVLEDFRQNGEENMYHLSLVGVREPDLEYNTNRLLQQGQIVRVEDYTEPALDMELLHQQYDGTIIEAYIEQFPTEPEGMELKALQYGIQALLETKRQI